MSVVWFKLKQYGWGWYPSSWQGWTILGIYILSVALAGLHANLFIVNNPSVLFSFLPEVIFYTIILIIVCYTTGETPRWQWQKHK